MRRAAALLGIVAALTIAGCGGSSGGGGVSVPTVSAAKVFSLGDFAPAGTITAGHPVTMSFDVRQPDGSALTRYKTGPGPHTGVHLIMVRGDLAYIIHDHPPITANGHLSQRVTFPAAGPWRVLVDVYPDIPGGQPNFQLFKTIQVAGAYHPKPIPPYRADQVIDGYHFDVQGKLDVHAIQATFVHVNVTDPHGAPVHFTPWFGALAHAIFFHVGSLDYFHTHVCAAGAPNCSSLLGASRITGHATAPGKLTLGVLLPVSGTWRLFLQLRVHGHVLTAPFTLQVTS